MDFALVFVLTAVAVIALADAIRAVPWLFYGLALAAVIVLFAGAEGWIGGAWWKPLILLVRRCMLALALFAVVMFTGTLSRDSKLGLRLRSVRSELSIIACVLCAGHVLAYCAAYVSRFLAGSLEPAVLAAISIAFLLAVLLVVLGVTSFAFVKKRMHASTWKRIQQFAYVFFALAYAHLLFMLAPAALNGSAEALTGVAVYTLLFGSYAAARIVRWRKDRPLGAGLQSEGGAVGACVAEPASE